MSLECFEFPCPAAYAGYSKPRETGLGLFLGTGDRTRVERPCSAEVFFDRVVQMAEENSGELRRYALVG